MGIVQFAPFLLHSVAVAHYMATEHYYSNHMDLPKTGAFEIFHTLGGRYKFLTIWNMVRIFFTPLFLYYAFRGLQFFQCVFFALCLLNDVFGSNEIDNDQKSVLRTVRDFLHATIGFPLSLVC